MGKKRSMATFAIGSHYNIKYITRNIKLKIGRNEDTLIGIRVCVNGKQQKINRK